MAWALPFLPLAKSFLLAQLTVCQPIGVVPRVDIYFFPDKPEYVTEAPYKALTEAMKDNPDSTFASDSKWIVFGITEGKVADSGFNVEFRTLRDQQGNTCLNVDNVKLVVHYTPTIFIAKEIKHLDCQFKMVKLHEERHVAADLKTIKEYIPKIKMDILWYLRSLGPQGPYNGAEVQKQISAISRQIAEATKPMVLKLHKVRRARQGAIDTIENYRQESSLCPDDLLQLKDIEK